MSDDTLLRLVEAADPLAHHTGSALPTGPEAVLQTIRDRLTSPRRPRRRVRLAAAALAGALAIAAGIAVAAGVNPLAGIGAADQKQRTRDILAPAIVASLRSDERHAGRLGPGAILPGTARLLGQLPSGRTLYVVASSKGELGVIVVRHGKLEMSEWADLLSQSQPITGGSFDPDGRRGPIPPLSFGLARNGITSVSFRAHGAEQTVRVIDNVWFYEGENSSLASITAHYRNGKTWTRTR
jgi:hypothetical protein